MQYAQCTHAVTAPMCTVHTEHRAALKMVKSILCLTFIVRTLYERVNNARPEDIPYTLSVCNKFDPRNRTYLTFGEHMKSIRKRRTQDQKQNKCGAAEVSAFIFVLAVVTFLLRSFYANQELLLCFAIRCVCRCP